VITKVTVGVGRVVKMAVAWSWVCCKDDSRMELAVL